MLSEMQKSSGLVGNKAVRAQHAFMTARNAMNKHYNQFRNDKNQGMLKQNFDRERKKLELDLKTHLSKTEFDRFQRWKSKIAKSGKDGEYAQKFLGLN